MNKEFQPLYKEVKTWCKQAWFMFKITVRLKMAIRLCRYKHYINNRKYWILPERTSGMIIANRNELKYYKKKGLFPSRWGNIEFTERAFYCTAEDRNGLNPPKKEDLATMKKNYFKWCKRLSPLYKVAKVGTPSVKSFK